MPTSRLYSEETAKWVDTFRMIGGEAEFSGSDSHVFDGVYYQSEDGKNRSSQGEYEPSDSNIFNDA